MTKGEYVCLRESCRYKWRTRKVMSPPVECPQCKGRKLGPVDPVDAKRDWSDQVAIEPMQLREG